MNDIEKIPFGKLCLSGQLEQAARLTGVTVDRGHQGHKHGARAKVNIVRTCGSASPTIKREPRRRNAIEPIVGRCKSDGLRNRLARAASDAHDAILVAAGHNPRLLVAWLAAPLRALLTACLPAAPRRMASV